MPIINRRNFICKSAALSFGLMNIPLINSNLHSHQKKSGKSTIVEVKHGSPREMVQKAVEALGGIGRFVKKGDVVVVKPNIGWARRPEQAANTNPEVVAEVVKLCNAAGASKVKVFDNTCNNAKKCYKLSGIEEAAKAEGAQVRYIYEQKFKKIKIPNGIILKSWEFYSDVLKADVFINIPIIKHHSLAQITMGFKNIMGVIGGNRGEIHNNFDQKLIDLNTIIKPQLTILDGINVLMRNGPVGGNINDVEHKNTIIAGTDQVAVDALGASLFGIEANTLGYLQEAYKRGFGEIDLNNVIIKKVAL